MVLETNDRDMNPGRVIRAIPAEGEYQEVEHLPQDVAGYYTDAMKILDAGVPDAAAVQLRRALEAAAAHHGISKGSLITRIRGLINSGLITSQFGQVLDHVRVIGNIGAHAGDERVDDEAARRALRFTTQVLRNLFEIPAELAAIASGEADSDEETAESVS